MQLETFGLPDANGNVVCRCPFGTHDDRHPSASFNVNTGLLYCFSCKHGSNSHLLKTVYGVEVPVIRNGNKIAVRRDDTRWRDLWRYSTPYSFADEYEDVLRSKAYAMSRGVTTPVAKRFSVRLSSSGVIFPFELTNGAVIGFQERRLDGSPKYMILGKRTPLWPYKEVSMIQSDKNVYLVEGIFSAIAMRSLGYQTFAIVGSRHQNAGEVVNVLSDFVDINKIVVSFDNDDAGHIATYEYMKYGVQAIVPGFSPDDASESAIEFMSDRHDNMRHMNQMGVDVYHELFS